MNACFYCARPMFETPCAPPGFLADQKQTRDHIVPKARRMGPIAGNILQACERCNVARGDLSAELYLEFAIGVLRDEPSSPAAATHHAFAAWLLARGLWPDGRNIPRKARRMAAAEVMARAAE